ncbi:MAG: glycosyltransferase family 8 protein [Pirellulaceae bacterium]
MSLVDLKTQPSRSDIQTSVDPVVLCAADDRYAMPLAVTLSSAATSLKVGHRLIVYLVDGGITEQSKALLIDSLRLHPVDLNWINADEVDLSDLSVSHHISHTAYLRLLADRWLPKEVARVIYLDSDLLILHSLTELWEEELGDHYCLAVPDIACPFMDAEQFRGKAKHSLPYLATWNPVPNYRELGLDGSAFYFNSGVMVMNIAKWREQKLGDKLLAALRENSEHVWCWDQYALNLVCAGHWRPLPMRWNVGGHVFEYPSDKSVPVSTEEYVEMTRDPAIVHFTTEFKPWDYFCSNPLRDRFYSQLDQTKWSGWRPQRPHFRLKDSWNRLAVWFCRNWVINYRKFKLIGNTRT